LKSITTIFAVILSIAFIIVFSSIFFLKKDFEVSVDLQGNWRKTSGLPFNWKDYNSTWILGFSGFIGCSNICPPRLQRLKEISYAFPSDQLTLVFFNTDPLTSFEELQDYLDRFLEDPKKSSFNKNPIIGLKAENTHFKTLLKNMKMYDYSNYSIRSKNRPLEDSHSSYFILIPPGQKTAYLHREITIDTLKKQMQSQ
jgi:cytochrome oxidase Cu insertion factor (SCO1/SenC/PrrC family)